MPHLTDYIDGLCTYGLIAVLAYTKWWLPELLEMVK